LSLYQCFATQVRPLAPGCSHQPAAGTHPHSPPDQSEALYGRPSLAAHLQAKGTFSFRGATMTSAAMSVFINVLVQTLPYSRFGGDEPSTVTGWSVWLPNIDSRPRLAPDFSLTATRTNPPTLSLYQCFGRPSPRCDKRLGR